MYCSYRPKARDAGRKMALGRGLTIDRNAIPTYFTDHYWSAFEIWRNWKRYGLPFAGGWAEHPDYLVRVINLFEEEINREE
jgi:hypothetical protein